MNQYILNSPRKNFSREQILEINQLFILLQSNQSLQNIPYMFKINPVEMKIGFQLFKSHGLKTVKII
jgi:hypothetical protein